MSFISRRNIVEPNIEHICKVPGFSWFNIRYRAGAYWACEICNKVYKYVCIYEDAIYGGRQYAWITNINKEELINQNPYKPMKKY